jgi:hypothetical protein
MTSKEGGLALYIFGRAVMTSKHGLALYTFGRVDMTSKHGDSALYTFGRAVMSSKHGGSALEFQDSSSQRPYCVGVCVCVCVDLAEEGVRRVRPYELVPAEGSFARKFMKNIERAYVALVLRKPAHFKHCSGSHLY